MVGRARSTGWVTAVRARYEVAPLRVGGFVVQLVNTQVVRLRSYTVEKAADEVAEVLNRWIDHEGATAPADPTAPCVSCGPSDGYSELKKLFDHNRLDHAAYNVLRRNGVTTVQELIDAPDYMLCDMKGMGPKIQDCIEQRLAAHVAKTSTENS